MFNPFALLSKAPGYLDQSWNKLTVYIEDGSILIDNNATENAVRPFVIKSKNGLFNDTVKEPKPALHYHTV